FLSSASFLEPLHLHFSLHDALPIFTDSIIVGGDFRVLTRFVRGARLRVAIQGSWSFADDALADTVAKISTVEHDFWGDTAEPYRSEEHTSELQSRFDLVCRLLLEKK